MSIALATAFDFFADNVIKGLGQRVAGAARTGNFGGSVGDWFDMPLVNANGGGAVVGRVVPRRMFRGRGGRGGGRRVYKRRGYGRTPYRRTYGTGGYRRRTYGYRRRYGGYRRRYSRRW